MILTYMLFTIICINKKVIHIFHFQVGDIKREKRTQTTQWNNATLLFVVILGKLTMLVGCIGRFPSK
ncbi:hypothetical protein HanPSC8_Chr16g0717551 [Helianthus annuus]|nr:hypothetical protein HanPSC8_Chr16g0717551 [Helianthus annuus]